MVQGLRLNQLGFKIQKLSVKGFRCRGQGSAGFYHTLYTPKGPRTQIIGL